MRTTSLSWTKAERSGLGFDLVSGLGAVSTPEGHELVELGDCGTAAEMMRKVELHALDVLPVLPFDRGEGDAMDALVSFACNRACDELWREARDGDPRREELP